MMLPPPEVAPEVTSLAEATISSTCESDQTESESTSTGSFCVVKEEEEGK